MRGKIVRGCVWGALLLGCLLLSWHCAETLGDLYPSVSVRLETPLTQAQAGTLEDAAYTVTCWWEEEGVAETDYAHCSALAVRYHGTLRDIRRLTLTEGTEPGALQMQEGLVSSALAQALWGSTNVVGQEFSWNGEIWTVSAVFEGDDCALCLPSETAAGAVCLELTGDIEDDPVGAVNDFLALTGLDGGAGTVYGPQMGALLRLLNWTPLTLCALWCLWSLKRRFPIRRLALRRGIFWGLVLLAAVLAPIGMGNLPGWLTPPRWSDFGFWYRLWVAAGERLEEWFRVVPLTKDVTAKRALLCWAAGWSGSLLCWSECRFLVAETAVRAGNRAEPQASP
ncbi:MAG: hypothetical protein LUH16_04525 [Clostridiales bacterium]|nr:hypothetical protein [Clostridiales bacterium]